MSYEPRNVLLLEVHSRKRYHLLCSFRIELNGVFFLFEYIYFMNIDQTIYLYVKKH